MTQPLDPETERHITRLAQLETERHVWLSLGITAANERDAAQRDNAILEQRIAESGSAIESAVETIREMKAELSAVRATLAAERREREADQRELYGTQAELSAARATLAAERTLRASFGGHLRALAEAYDMAPGGAFEPAKVVRAAVETKAELERLREAATEYHTLSCWPGCSHEFESTEQRAKCIAASEKLHPLLLRLHERNKP